MNKDRETILPYKIVNCSDIEKLLDAYLDGELAPLLKRRYDRHLEHCELCASLVLDCQQIVRVAKTISEKTIPHDVSRRLRERLSRETGYQFTAVFERRGRVGPKLGS